MIFLMRCLDEIAVSSDALDQKSFSYLVACQEQQTFFLHLDDR